MKTFASTVGIGISISLAFIAPALGLENSAWIETASETTSQHFLLAQAVNQTGTIKWFNEDKGFGFITPDDGSKDIIFFGSAFQGDGLWNLTLPQKVMYDVNPGIQGPSAVNVRAI